MEERVSGLKDKVEMDILFKENVTYKIPVIKHPRSLRKYENIKPTNHKYRRRKRNSGKGYKK